MNRHSRLGWTLFLLLLAFGLRVSRLAQVPPGLQVDDERWNLEIIDQLQRGDWQLFYTGGWGRESAFYYVAALWERVFGENYILLRLLSVFSGTLTVALAFRLARRMFGWLTGWLSGAGVALSMWALFYSRIIFRAALLPPLLLLGINLFWDGLATAGDVPHCARKARWRWLGFGLVYGLLFYVYTSARVLPFFFLSFVLYLALLHRDLLRQAAKPMIGAFLIVIPMVLPLLWTLLNLSGAGTRFEQVGGPMQGMAEGNLDPLFQAVRNTVGMFLVRGSASWRYNWPGRPIFDPLGGVLFLLGMVLACWRWRERAYALLLLWWALGLVPGFLSVGSPSTVRTLLSMPPTYVFPALALAQIAKWLGEHSPGRRVFAALLPAVYLLVTGVLTWRDYLIRWPSQPQVRDVFQFTLTQAARFAEDRSSLVSTAMSGVLDANRDPYSVDHIRSSTGWTPRWFDGRYALLVPASDLTTLVVPEYVPLAATLEALVSHRDLAPYRSPLLTTDSRPIFTAYTGDLRSALEQRIAEGPNLARWGADEVRTLDDWEALPAASLPVDVGGLLLLRGYEIPDGVQRGTTLAILDYWQVQVPSQDAWVIFVHLLNGKGEWVSGYDRLDALPSSWQAGDLLVQIHDLWIPADIPPDLYTVRVGVYNRDTMQRLDWHVQSQASVDHVILAPLEVR